jgi:hypothetical protein
MEQRFSLTTNQFHPVYQPQKPSIEQHGSHQSNSTVVIAQMLSNL